MTRLNKVLIQGRFGAEPEISMVEGGRRMARFRVAVDYRVQGRYRAMAGAGGPG